MDIGAPELLIVLIIVVLLFGPSRIGKVAGELGKGLRSFRDGLSGEEEEAQQKSSKAGAAQGIVHRRPTCQLDGSVRLDRARKPESERPH